MHSAFDLRRHSAKLQQDALLQAVRPTLAAGLRCFAHSRTLGSDELFGEWVTHRSSMRAAQRANNGAVVEAVWVTARGQPAAIGRSWVQCFLSPSEGL